MSAAAALAMARIPMPLLHALPLPRHLSPSPKWKPKTLLLMKISSTANTDTISAQMMIVKWTWNNTQGLSGAEADDSTLFPDGRNRPRMRARLHTLRANHAIKLTEAIQGLRPNLTFRAEMLFESTCQKYTQYFMWLRGLWIWRLLLTKVVGGSII